MTSERLAESRDSPSLIDSLARTLRIVPDFPEPGIMFQDITPVLGDAALFGRVIEAMAAPWRGRGITHVAGVESRGFILAAPVALALGAGLIPIRKPGKLPWRTTSCEYALEYGTGRVELHVDGVTAGERVLIIDDLLATGGTAMAAIALLERVGAHIVECAFVIDLIDVGGRARLEQRGYRVHALCGFTEDEV